MKKTLTTFGLLLLFSCGMVFTGTAQEITGSWKGVLAVQGTEIPILFHVKQEGTGYSSTMDSPSQGATGIQMDNTTFTNNNLTITFAKAGIKYIATASENKLTGTFYQGTNEIPLLMTKTENTLPGNT
ncbi:MAG: S9 family peptidase, partial [Flavobacteriaceae bacterium]|nr:S9 family peptidase [Flavobacteriaceae bacterium]